MSRDSEPRTLVVAKTAHEIHNALREILQNLMILGAIMIALGVLLNIVILIRVATIYLCFCQLMIWLSKNITRDYVEDEIRKEQERG